jgi:hypothetical protein
VEVGADRGSGRRERGGACEGASVGVECLHKSPVLRRTPSPKARAAKSAVATRSSLTGGCAGWHVWAVQVRSVLYTGRSMPTVDVSLQVRRPPTSVGAVSWGQEQVGGWLSGRKRVRPTDGWMNARRSLPLTRDWWILTARQRAVVVGMWARMGVWCGVGVGVERGNGWRSGSGGRVGWLKALFTPNSPTCHDEVAMGGWMWRGTERQKA